MVRCMAGLVPLLLGAGAVTPYMLAAAAAEQLRNAMAPPQVPLSAIMPELREGYLHHPLLQAYLLQEEIPPVEVKMAGLVGTLVRVPSRSAVPEITIELWPQPAAGGVLRYRTDAIAESDAAMLAEQFVANVETVAQALTDHLP